ncbi:SIS domain-containing protein [Nonomuraea turcica]|uniref:SIS domain-containing protein n=1 Tax=Nonomuraea sp. G32 TaxID=3067274 RepID=UPI00273A84B0|nr:SIS domain-containing protein [Nonomuraea sp. G32]MDP4505690.1 SIS domain-containing protein [Nonomuraea sp. G32]
MLSTKSIISQAIILGRLALEVGRQSAVLSAGRYQDRMDSIVRLPTTLEAFIDGASGSIGNLARKYKDIQHLFFVGRGALYPVALESALKYKKATYRHAEGMSAGFFKHGTISLIAPGFVTVSSYLRHMPTVISSRRPWRMSARSPPAEGKSSDSDPMTSTKPTF